MKSAFLIDVHNLYVGIGKKFPGRVLNYTAVLEGLAKDGYDLFYRAAYGRQPEEKVRGFSTMLKKNGFELFFGNTPHNIEMAIRAADLIHTSKVDCLVLGTNYFEAGRIARYARERGIHTIMAGVDLPEFFKSFAQTWEFDEALLQERKPNASTQAA
jgi:uncharacterized LabA/DUF88 family protein